MDASRKIFLKKGYKNASLVEVADDTKIGRRTIYRYFENKELLLIKVLTNGFDDFNKHLENIVYEDGITSSNKLKVLFDNYLSYFLSNPEMLRLMSMVDVNISDFTKESKVYRNLVATTAFADEILMGILIEAKNDGSVSSNVGADVLAITINSSLLALASRVMNNKNLLDKEQGIESTHMLVTLRDLILNSIITR